MKSDIDRLLAVGQGGREIGVDFFDFGFNPEREEAELSEIARLIDNLLSVLK